MEKKYSSQQKWQKKVGLISKSYKLKKTLVDEFAETCNAGGVGQAAQLTRLMEGYIAERKGKKDMKELIERIDEQIEKKAMKTGKMGTEAITVFMDLTNEEADFIRKGEHKYQEDLEHYSWEINGNELWVSYTEE